MSFRYKVLGVLSIAVAALTISLNPVKAAAEDKQALPVPPHTQQVKKEARRIAAAEFDFTYYTSAQAPTKLKDFYRHTLANSGWKEKTLLKDLEQIPDFQMQPGLSSALEQNLLFEKEGATLIINFLPGGFYRDQKTRFTLAQGKIDLESAGVTEMISLPELLTKPKKEVAPTYPGAALISLSEPAEALTAAYFTPDDINKVSAFYKARMPNYGWSLIEEKAPEKIEMPQTSKEEIVKLCPACAEKASISPQGIEAWMAQLSFLNASHATCNILLSRVISGEAAAGEAEAEKMEMTTILVNYAEKKK